MNMSRYALSFLIPLVVMMLSCLDVCASDIMDVGIKSRENSVLQDIAIESSCVHGDRASLRLQNIPTAFFLSVKKEAIQHAERRVKIGYRVDGFLTEVLLPIPLAPDKPISDIPLWLLFGVNNHGMILKIIPIDYRNPAIVQEYKDVCTEIFSGHQTAPDRALSFIVDAKVRNDACVLGLLKLKPSDDGIQQLLVKASALSSTAARVASLTFFLTAPVSYTPVEKARIVDLLRTTLGPQTHVTLDPNSVWQPSTLQDVVRMLTKLGYE